MINDDFFNIPHYSAKVEQLYAKKSKKTTGEIEIKSKKILREISTVLSREGNDARFQITVDKVLEDISKLHVGRKLFKKIKNSPFPIIIRIDSFARVMDLRINDELDWGTGEFKAKCAWITFPQDYLDDSVPLYSMSDGYPIALGLVHELIHVLHYIENQWEYRLRSHERSGLLDCKFDDMEEQYTICGVKADLNGNVSLCENAFVKAFGYNFRKSHKDHPTKLGQV